jgi:hypothetical protein
MVKINILFGLVQCWRNEATGAVGLTSGLSGQAN